MIMEVRVQGCLASSHALFSRNCPELGMLGDSWASVRPALKKLQLPSPRRCCFAVPCREGGFPNSEPVTWMPLMQGRCKERPAAEFMVTLRAVLVSAR